MVRTDKKIFSQHTMMVCWLGFVFCLFSSRAQKNISLPAVATSEKNKVDKLNCPATVHCPCISCVDDGWSGHSYSACIRISLYGIFYRSITTMQQGRWLPWMSRKNVRLWCTIRNESMSWWWSLRSIRKRIFISKIMANRRFALINFERQYIEEFEDMRRDIKSY